MSLVDVQSALKVTLQLLAKIDPPGGIELLSYKRNRTITVLILPDSQVMIRERGYMNQTLTVPFSSAAKNVKQMMKREFPRSRKVRLYKIGHPDEIDRERNRI